MCLCILDTLVSAMALRCTTHAIVFIMVGRRCFGNSERGFWTSDEVGGGSAPTQILSINRFNDPALPYSDISLQSEAAT